MIQTSFYQPSSNCSCLVRHYLFLKLAKGQSECTDKFVPNGSASLVFNFNNNATYVLDNKQNALPPFFLVNPLLQSLTIGIKAPMDSMVITCKASVLSRLYNIEMDKHPDKPYQVIQYRVFNPLWKELYETESESRRIKIFEDFLKKNGLLTEYRKDEIDLVYEKIISAGGTAPVQEIIKGIKMNPRTFRRQFNKRVGINAKGLSRIVRVNYLWDRLQNFRDIDFQKMVFEGGFFDQSHLIKDFRKIIGEPPESFFKRNLEKVKVISGKMN